MMTVGKLKKKSASTKRGRTLKLRTRESAQLLVNQVVTIDRPLNPSPVEYDGMWMYTQGIRWGAVTNPTKPKCPYTKCDHPRASAITIGKAELCSAPIKVMRMTVGCPDTLREVDSLRWFWRITLHTQA
jgi:hypothetical protein